MSDCCKHHDTAFCPECGSPIFAPPMHQLLNHCTRQASLLQKRLDSLRNEVTDGYDSYEQQGYDSDYHQRSLQRVEKNWDKWHTWSDGLRELIEGQGGGET